MMSLAAAVEAKIVQRLGGADKHAQSFQAPPGLLRNNEETWINEATKAYPSLFRATAFSLAQLDHDKKRQAEKKENAKKEAADLPPEKVIELKVAEAVAKQTKKGVPRGGPGAQFAAARARIQGAMEKAKAKARATSPRPQKGKAKAKRKAKAKKLAVRTKRKGHRKEVARVSSAQGNI